jgi:hypothetical protein
MENVTQSQLSQGALPGPRRRLRWSLPFVLAFIVGMSLSVRNAAAAEEEQKCSDFTPDNRPCTAMEELGYCLTIAIEAYDECLDDAGLLGKLACTIAYEVDYYTCALELPIKVFK